MAEPLVSASRLHDLLGDPALVVVDCRFSLADPGAGRRAYDQGHLAGAVYAHLEQDLSGEILRGRTGRHPLPAPGGLAEQLGRWGISGDSRVVAYDDGTCMAGRRPAVTVEPGRLRQTNCPFAPSRSRPFATSRPR